MAGSVVSGKVVSKEGKFFLEAAGKMHEIPAGAMETKLKELVGQEVEVFLSEPQTFVVGFKPKPWCYYTCYIAPPDWRIPFLVPEKEAIKKLADQFLKQGVITREVHGKITK